MEYYAALNQKEIFSKATTLMNLEDITSIYTKWNTPVTNREIIRDSTYGYDVSKVVRLLETESITVVAKAAGGGEMGAVQWT